jgi:hypothetical protein
VTKRETPPEYAQRRANETGRAYLVTNMGHAMMLTGNRRLAQTHLGGIAQIVRKARKAVAR